MYNTAMYNIQPYNRKLLDEIDYFISVLIEENLHGTAGTGINYHVFERLNETLSAAAAPAIAYFADKDLYELLGGKITPSAAYYESGAISEIMEGLAAWAATYSPTVQFLEILGGTSVCAAIYAETAALLEELDGIGILSAIYSDSADLFEALDGAVSVYDIEVSSVTISGQIPPGGTLVIDSEFYTVTLNNQNVIDRHGGDWIWADRTTESVEISASGISALDWEVMYIAEYL
ncbi:MAG: hypothetical protein LBC56_04420 [Oscillospiraceae bacterium]|nr:hypothetical protein [Oscillospiraceae bacterium]